MRHWTTYLCLILLFFCFGKSTAQPYAFQTYSLAEGLPQSQVWCGYSDHKGFLWFGTQGGGLSRYDGLEFETFTTQNGLPSNFINALYQDAQNHFWIGTNNGLCRFRGQQFSKVPNSNISILSLQDLNDSLLIIGTVEGLYTLDQDSFLVEKWKLHDALDQAEIYTLKQWKGEIYAGTSTGLWRIWPAVENIASFPNVYDLSSHNDTLWAAVYGRGIYYLEKENFKALQIDYRLTRPMSILKDAQGTLHVGTQNLGLFYYNTSTSNWEVSPGQDQAQNNVRALLTDQSQRLWICSSGGGIACRNQQNFQHFDRSDGLAGERVYAIHKDTAQNLWLATSRRGLQVRDSSGFLPPVNALPLGSVKYKTIAEDNFGQIWIGTEGKGVAVQDTTAWHTIDVDNGLPSNWILKLIAHPDGTIWGATYSNGLFSIRQNGYRDYTVTSYGRRAGIEDLRISAFCMGPNEDLWFGTSSGDLGTINTGKFSYTQQAQGIANTTVRSITFDAFNRIWVGTKGRGLFTADLKADTLQFDALSAILI